LGKDIKPGVPKEHWARVKALSRRLADGSADEYDTLRPVADLHLFLQQELYKAIQEPRDWKPRPPSDDEKQAFFDRFVNRLNGDIMAISARRLRLKPVSEWQEAYNQTGRGSSFVRASIIADRIYTPAAPVAPTPDRTSFLKEVLDTVEKAAPECSAELR
jgi:ClpP class serine protease